MREFFQKDDGFDFGLVEFGVLVEQLNYLCPFQCLLALIFYFL